MQKGVVVFVVVEVLVVIVVIVVTVVVMRQYELAQMKTGTHTISVCTKETANTIDTVVVGKNNRQNSGGNCRGDRNTNTPREQKKKKKYHRNKLH